MSTRYTLIFDSVILTSINKYRSDVLTLFIILVALISLPRLSKYYSSILRLYTLLGNKSILPFATFKTEAYEAQLVPANLWTRL